jgi:hypothetical protein
MPQGGADWLYPVSGTGVDTFFPPPVRRFTHRKSADVFYMRNPAGFRNKSILLLNPILNLFISTHDYLTFLHSTLFPPCFSCS